MLILYISETLGWIIMAFVCVCVCVCVYVCVCGRGGALYGWISNLFALSMYILVVTFSSANYI